MILIGIAYHKNKRYALDHVLEWVDQQTYKDVEVVLRVHTGRYGEANAVKQQREFFRTLALQLHATHCFMLGADTIPPLDALERLLAHDKDVVGGLYRYRSDEAPAVAWVDGDDDKAWLDGQHGLVEVSGMGNDCVLLSRRALESVSFMDWDVSDDDWPYYNRLREQGHYIWLDTDIICRHYADEHNYH